MMQQDVKLLLTVYLLMWGLQVAAWPWLFGFNKRLVDRGWAAGRIVASLIVALSVWMMANLRFPINTQAGVTGVIVFWLTWTWKKRRKEIRQTAGWWRPDDGFAVRRAGWLIVGEEVLFLLGFVGYGLIRGYQPDILGLEKFMDFGFIKSYLATPTLPATDMWWAGGTINYYSFGHFWSSILIRIWGVGATVGYNLMLAFILANSLALAFSVVVNLASSGGGERLRGTCLLGGIVGAVWLCFGGNSHTIWSWLAKGTLNGYWYAAATRFIHNTIHEFPAYSFVVSDLHGHVLSLPIVLSFLLFWVNWGRGMLLKEKVGWAEGAILGGLLGVMTMTNTWDAMIYALLLAIFGILLLLRDRRQIWNLGRQAMIVGGSGLVVAGLWLMNFRPISQGVAAVAGRSEVWQLLVLWTIHLGISLTAIAASLLEKRTNLLAVAVALTAITLVLLPEFVYVVDIYQSHPRANTMFKLTYQAFVLMSLLFGFLVIRIIEIVDWRWRMIAGTGMVAVAVAVMMFSMMAFPSYYGNFRSYRGLDGSGFLRTRFEDDWRTIDFLEKNKNGKNMVEAVGDSYSETDFVSAFSGVPTILGWRVHEWLWRGGYEVVGKRDEEVKRFYETEETTERKALIDKYRLGFVIVGPREREKYQVLQEEQIVALGEKLTFGASYVIKIRE